MKLFLLLFLISFNCFAGFVAGSKINECSRTDYISPSACQETEGELCYKVPEDSGQCGIFKLKNTHSGPKVNEETCSGSEECQVLLSEKVCSVNHDAFIDENYTGVYCIEITGKELVVDSVLKAQADAAAYVKALDDAAEKNALARAECGRTVIARILIRNAPKGLSKPQVKSMSATFAFIQGLLLNGSLETAREEILAVQADGVVVTEADKVALVQKLDSCKPQ